MRSHERRLAGSSPSLRTASVPIRVVRHPALAAYSTTTTSNGRRVLGEMPFAVCHLRESRSRFLAPPRANSARSGMDSLNSGPFSEAYFFRSRDLEGVFAQGRGSELTLIGGSLPAYNIERLVPRCDEAAVRTRYDSENDLLTTIRCTLVSANGLAYTTNLHLGKENSGARADPCEKRVFRSLATRPVCFTLQLRTIDSRQSLPTG